MTQKKYSSEAILCLHCGNETILEVISNVNEEEHEFDFHPNHGKIPIATFYITYTLYKCPTCKKVTLKSSEYNDQEMDYIHGGPYVYKEFLYPVQTGDLSFIPTKIGNAYESALKTRNVDNVLCAIGLRRTLEILCHDQEAEGRSLFNKLEYLSKEGIIPSVLDDASHLIRTIGNSAAHDVEAQFNKKIIDDMIRFTRIILEYVYVIPKEIDRIQTHFDKNEK